MAMNKYNKSMLINLLFSGVFIISGLYLAMHYYMEYPHPQLHWEGILPLAVCLVYYIFS
jgi:hypothetical protein